MMAALGHAGKFLAGAVPTAVMAGLGMPESGVLILVLAVMMLGAACWVIRSDARTDRVSRMLLAWRGNADSLGRGAAAPGPPGLRPRRWRWQRRPRIGRRRR
ncbi:MAG TPA: hypothetical protein VFQ68_19010 [Streptosporangiaceae bacterium]|nr:hypothetical protein [Streptosporangiaceae bacterium]